jgi:hypothetical protein
MKISIFTFVLFMFVSFAASAGKDATKFYNFDDLLINGKVKKPQVLYTDARQKIKFGKLLKLRKDFLPKLESTKKDKTLR